MTGADPARPPLVDVHAHFLTDRYIEEATATGHVKPDGAPGWADWSARQHLELMDQWGIATSVLSISSPGVSFGSPEANRSLARHINETGAELRRAHPERFGHFASLPLTDIDDALAELEYALGQLGADGVTVESNLGGKYLGNPHFAPLLAELDRRATPVFVHPTSPPNAEDVTLGLPAAVLEFPFDTTRAVADLGLHGRFASHPHIPWIFTHGGGALPLLTERLEFFRSAFAGPGDTTTPLTEQVAGLWFDMAGTPFPLQIPALARAFGSEHVLYGSDYCWTPPSLVAPQLASLKSAPQPEGDTWRALTTRNAQRLFPRLKDLA
jgi:predicted TIM-barrel fold metal-dependent hydrolase